MTNNNQVSALQATVMVAVALFMVGKAVYEIYVMIGKLALTLGRKCAKWYYASEIRTEQIDDVIEAVNVEAVEMRKAVGTYICGWCLFASTVHAMYIYLSNFDYVKSVELEGKVRKYTVDIWEWYVTEWKKVLT